MFTTRTTDSTRRTPPMMPHHHVDIPDSSALPKRRDAYLPSPDDSPRIYSGPLMPDEDEVYEPAVSPCGLPSIDRAIRRGTVAPPSAAVQWTAVQTGRPVMPVFAQQHTPAPPPRDLPRAPGSHGRQLSADAEPFRPRAPAMQAVPLPMTSHGRGGSRSTRYPDSPPPSPHVAPQRNTPALRLHNELGKLHKVRDIRYQQNPDHWVAVISVDGRDCGVGRATGKKEAEQRAAMAALQNLGIPYPC